MKIFVRLPLNMKQNILTIELIKIKIFHAEVCANPSCPNQLLTNLRLATPIKLLMKMTQLTIKQLTSMMTMVVKMTTVAMMHLFNQRRNH
eukprot:8543668-Ditylum_brightwellii.AAC.1